MTDKINRTLGTASPADDGLKLWTEELLSWYPDEVFLHYMTPRVLPGYRYVPLTFWERVRTYLPWSWNSNHRAKSVYLGPSTIKFNRFRAYEGVEK